MKNTRLIIGAVLTLLLGGIGVFTAWWFYLRGPAEPVAPTAPESRPKAAESAQPNPISLNPLEFEIGGGDTGSGSGDSQQSSGSTPTPSPTATPTPTNTPTPTPTDSPSSSPTATPTPTSSTSPSTSESSSSSSSSTSSIGGTLPEAGFPLPAITAMGAGAIILLLGLLLAI